MLNKSSVGVIMLIENEKFIHRHEYKYLLNLDNYYQLKDEISKTMQVDENAGEEQDYHIRSMYFDDMYDTALTDKLLGKVERMKYRVRIYNFSSKVINLEIKEKREEYIQKKSSLISLEEFERILNGDVIFLLNNKDFVRSRFYYEYRNNLLRPKVIVDYNREAYTLPYNKVRVTFDKNLSAALPQNDLFSKDIFSKNVGEKYSIIMEIKYNNFLPNYIRSILERQDLTRLAVSKYVICREATENK